MFVTGGGKEDDDDDDLPTTAIRSPKVTNPDEEHDSLLIIHPCTISHI